MKRRSTIILLILISAVLLLWVTSCELLEPMSISERLDQFESDLNNNRSAVAANFTGAAATAAPGVFNTTGGLWGTNNNDFTPSL